MMNGLTIFIHVEEYISFSVFRVTASMFKPVHCFKAVQQQSSKGLKACSLSGEYCSTVRNQWLLFYALK